MSLRILQRNSANGPEFRTNSPSFGKWPEIESNGSLAQVPETWGNPSRSFLQSFHLQIEQICRPTTLMHRSGIITLLKQWRIPFEHSSCQMKSVVRLKSMSRIVIRIIVHCAVVEYCWPGMERNGIQCHGI